VLSLFALFAIQLENTSKHGGTTDYRNQTDPETLSDVPESGNNIGAPHETVTFLSSLPAVVASGEVVAYHHQKTEPDVGVEQQQEATDYTSQQVQVVQTDSGEILLVTCDPILQEPDRY
jgi:hypothetical protein